MQRKPTRNTRGAAFEGFGLKVLDLFSGIGGFSLGLERAGFETVAFCEQDEYCQQVLKKHWPDVPIFNDVKTLDYKGSVDVICGGFPCQPFSNAGKRRGTEDDRDLWPAMFKQIQQHRPSWVIGENVTGFVNMALERTLSDLESEGYQVRVFNIPACAVSAPHERKRIWIVAYSSGAVSGGGPAFGDIDGQGRSSSEEGGKGLQPENRQACTDNLKSSGEDVANSKRLQESFREGFSSFREEKESFERGQPGGRVTERRAAWPTESGICRVANGVPRRVDRLRALGNSVVPQIPEIIGRAILAAETQS